MPISPAPWILDGLHEDADGKHYRVLSQGKLVAKVYDGEEGHANSRLITAAPELREAVMGLRDGELGRSSKYVANVLARSSEV